MSAADFAQGSPAWFKARVGRVTASRIKDVCASGKGGAPSVTREAYMGELIAERLTGESAGDTADTGADLTAEGGAAVGVGEPPDKGRSWSLAEAGSACAAARAGVAGFGAAWAACAAEVADTAAGDDAATGDAATVRELEKLRRKVTELETKAGASASPADVSALTASDGCGVMSAVRTMIGR